MKVLFFHAGHSTTAMMLAARAVKALRDEGHSAGERYLPAFKLEKEPADKVIIALTEEQADRYKDRGLEVVGIFGKDAIVPIELPKENDELEDFDVQSIVAEIDGPPSMALSMEQAKAEAVERGLEVNAGTTRLELERMLGVDIHPASQEADRRTDQTNNQNLGEPRIGVRTSNVLPTVNGLDLARMNDEQLRATAANAGIKTTANMRRETIINKLTSTFAKTVGAPEPQADHTGTAATDPGSKELPSSETELPSLDGMDADELKAQAEKEGVDIGRKTSVDSIREAIQAHRDEVKAHG